MSEQGLLERIQVDGSTTQNLRLTDVAFPATSPNGAARDYQVAGGAVSALISLGDVERIQVNGSTTALVLPATFPDNLATFQVGFGEYSNKFGDTVSTLSASGFLEHVQINGSTTLCLRLTPAGDEESWVAAKQ